jgi:C4-dicarboxylate-specific signal transduction histidine kinase
LHEGPGDPGPSSFPKPFRISGIFADITARKVAEAEADLQRKEVSHLMRVSVLGELSGAIAHELNQPLSIILTNAQAAQHMLAGDAPDIAELRDILADIVGENIRAGEVITRLRALLKRGETRLLPLALNEVIEDVLRLLRSNLVARGVTVQTTLADGLPDVPGDEVQLQQVLLNLLMNAMDAMNETPSADRVIAVGTRFSGKETIEAFISDRGRGIAAEEHPRIFQPFFTTKHQGLGLGLAICSTIVKAHGGKLGIDNNAGGGARASFTLPVIIELVPVS